MTKMTITEVAKRAGCSRTTVSRYLNGKFEFMSEDTRRQIAAVIEEVDYKPNRMARGLRLQESKQIGVVVSDIRSPFSSILYAGILEECEKQGYSALLVSSEDDPHKEQHYIQSMLAQSVDGIILNGTGENVDYIRSVNESLLPIVLADRPISDTDCDLVTSDAREGVWSMMEYLAKNGYTDIALVSKTIGTNGTRLKRYQEFSLYTKENYHREPFIIEYKGTGDKNLEKRILSFLKQASTGKKALFAVNGVVISELAKILNSNKIAYPEQIGLCGFDNYEWMELIGPGITVIEHQIKNMGKMSARCIIDRLQKKKAHKVRLIELSCKLIARGSI